MRWRRCGEDAALLDCDSLDEMRAAHATVLAARPAEVVELVPGARSLLVVGGVAAVKALLDDADLTHPPAGEPREVTLDVHYDGEDLSLSPKTPGCPRTPSSNCTPKPSYTVAFTGFAPGFGYLTGLPAQLRQPRLESPRTRVPAGSVGLAGEFTGVYPRESPGGWRLLGHTSATLFDPHADPPALFAPGDRVRFRAVR